MDTQTGLLKKSFWSERPTRNSSMESTQLPHINNITVSGRIGSGATTLAKQLAEELGWEMMDGGKLFRQFMKEEGISVVNTNGRPDQIDLDYEKKVQEILQTKTNQIIQSHLAGFDAQGIPNVFKLLIICEDLEGNDKPEIRIDRLVNRDKMSVESAKHEIQEREKQNLEKWRRLYAQNDPQWVYYDKKYYDLVINTYSHNPEETLKIALQAIGYKA